YSFELSQLGLDHRFAVGLAAVQVKIVLMIIARAVKNSVRIQLCYYFTFIGFGLVQFVDVIFCLLLLCGIMIKYSRTVLSTYIISLPVKLRGIMSYEEGFQ